MGLQEELPRGVWSSTGVPQCFTRSSPVLSVRISLLSPRVSASWSSLPSSGASPEPLHAASEGILQTLLLVVGFWPSCCGKSTCYHSAGVSKH